SDGLTTPETNGGFQPSSWQDSDGRLWFATVRGLATVDPKAIGSEPSRPRVVIEGLRADARAYVVANDRSLPPQTHVIEIEYTGLTSVAPEQLAFRYRFDGLDRDWTYVQDRRTAYFSRLQPGRYVFAVQAGSREGTWSADTARLAFIIPPVWYAT